MLNKYSAMIIFESSMSEENILKALGRVKDEIGKLGGKGEDGRIIGKHTFARPMHKKNDGIYVKLGFELDPSRMKALNERLRLNDEVFRVQIIKAVEAKAGQTEEKSDG